MPPKAKFTREEIVSAAFEMVRADGIECLTARALGEKLGSSARPIFTVFGGMEEIRREVIAAATALYDGYVAKGLAEKLAFKGVGTAYIRFAAEEPKLFNLLFMKEKDAATDKDSVLSVLDGNTEKIISSITDGYGGHGGSRLAGGEKSSGAGSLFSFVRVLSRRCDADFDGRV